MTFMLKKPPLLVAGILLALSLLPGTASRAELLRISVDNADGTTHSRWTPGTSRSHNLQIPPTGYIHAVGTRHQGCVGYIDLQPTLTVYLSSSTQSSVTVTSQADPVLFMVGPRGQMLCNDDFNGLDPSIEGTFDAGQWDIYVGSYSQRQAFPFTLTIH